MLVSRKNLSEVFTVLTRFDERHYAQLYNRVSFVTFGFLSGPDSSSLLRKVQSVLIFGLEWMKFVSANRRETL